jgi:antitoxin MazE
MGVRASIVRVGNSRGIRIPKHLIDECRLGDRVELSVVDGTLVVKPAVHVRQDWDSAFQRMSEVGDDVLLDAETPTQFDAQEWEWSPR